MDSSSSYNLGGNVQCLQSPHSQWGLSVMFSEDSLIRRAAIGRKGGRKIDWTLKSALKKNCFHLREGQLLHI